MYKSYYVKDKGGFVEMEICYCGNGRFTVHYPQYEQQEEILHSTTCFLEVNSEQLGMILFAYDKDEYLKFCEFWKNEVIKQ